jgi:hypothetical protein
MFTRLFSTGALFALLMASPIRAADSPTPSDAPTLLLRLASIEELLAKGEYLATLAGQEEVARQAVGFVRALANDKGLEGIDIKRPFAIYGNLTADVTKSLGVLLIPIADQESFLGLLKNRLHLEPKEENGVYRVQLPNVPVPAYFRFARGYLHATALTPAPLDEKNLADPEKVIGKPDGLFDLSVRIDQIPEQVKKVVLGQVETRLVQFKQEKLPGETPALAELRKRAIDSGVGGLKALLFEGKELKLKLAVDTKAEEVVFDWGLSAKEGSSLAQQFTALKDRKSIAGGWDAKGAAFRGLVHLALPDALHDAFSAVIDEGVDKGIAEAPADARPIAEKLLKAIVPTLKSGVLDGGMTLLGPDKDGKFTFLMAGKVEKGGDIEKALKEVVTSLPAEAQNVVEIDADKAGDTAMHAARITDILGDRFTKLFGTSPLWIALRDDRTMLATGPGSKETVKQAATKEPAAAPIVLLEVSVARVAPLFDEKHIEAARAVAESIFGSDPKGDKVTAVLEGGDRLHLRIAVSGKVLKFVTAMQSAEGPKQE